MCYIIVIIMVYRAGNYSKRFIPYTKEELETRHTGTLFKWLGIARNDDKDAYFDEKTLKYAEFKLLKEILDNRPHVPNKIERKLARQEEAKKRQNH